MTIKKFFAFSLVLHAIILIGAYFLPVTKEKKEKEFLTRLVSPDEIKSPDIKLPGPSVQPTPVMPPAIKKIKPLPSIPEEHGKKILPPVIPVKPKPVPTPEKPVVPGEGEDTGKPLPEGLLPKAGEGGRTRKDSESNGSLKPGYSERERIFDRGIIGDIAKKDSGQEMKKDNSITFDTAEYRYAGYMKKLKEKIESIWVYPPEASKRGIYGDLKIRFTIKKNGKLGAVELVRTSGFKMLDDAAIQALKDGEPYWPLPDEWGMESYTIMGHFIYSIYGYYVR
ncbi:MAG: TonB family protein [Nitrospirota bacterium]